MSAAIMPAQHRLRQTARAAETQNAFHVLHLCGRHFFVGDFAFTIVVAREPRKEACWRKLFAVAHYDVLLRPRKSAERVHGLHLAGFVDHEQVKFERAGFEELRHGKRAHHEDWFDGLHDRTRILEQLAHGTMPPLAFQLGKQHARSAQPGMTRGQPIVVFCQHPVFREREPIFVGAAKLLDDALVLHTVKLCEFRSCLHRLAEQPAEIRTVEHVRSSGVRQTAIFHRLDYRPKTELAGTNGAEVPSIPARQVFQPFTPLRETFAQRSEWHALHLGASKCRNQVQRHLVFHRFRCTPRLVQSLFDRYTHGGEVFMAVEFAEGLAKLRNDTCLRLAANPCDYGRELVPIRILSTPCAAESLTALFRMFTQDEQVPPRDNQVVQQRYTLTVNGRRLTAEQSAQHHHAATVPAIQKAEERFTVSRDARARLRDLVTIEIEIKSRIGHASRELLAQRCESAAVLYKIARPFNTRVPHAVAERIAVERRC